MKGRLRMNQRYMSVVISVLCVLALFMSGVRFVSAESAVVGETVTIIGTVNGSDQLVSEDGTIYEIDITDAGNEMVEQVDKKVEAAGVVEDLDGVKSLSVSSYRVIE
jgi:hypothetical protein